MKKKMLKKLAAFAAASVMLTSSMTAFAGGSLTYVTEENFDYEWYLQQHSDLAAVYSAQDKEAIWDFYENVGKPAGWQGRKDPRTLVLTAFDAERYARENPDLVAVFGMDEALLKEHYKTNGINEGRKAYSTRDDINAYLEIYRIAEEITANCNNNKEKVKAVHDWLCKNVAYDYDNYLSDSIPRDSYYETGVIFNHRAVCNGYAVTFQDFMDVLGIECETISGTARNSAGSVGGHAWNRVKLNGVWYYIDVTWDDPVPDSGQGVVYQYKYYLVTDPTFGGNHYPDN